MTDSKCTHPHCNEVATTCAEHVRDAASEAVRAPLAAPIAALAAMIRGLALVKPPSDEGQDLVSEYVRGKIEGLETAITLLEGAQS